MNIKLNFKLYCFMYVFKALMFSLFIFLLEGCSFHPHPNALWKNFLGNRALENKQTTQAEVYYLESLVDEPFLSANHINLGLIFELGDQKEKALHSYAQALEYSHIPIKDQKEIVKSERDITIDPLMSFVAHFNWAQLLEQKGELEQALKHYQSALALIPTSIEVKTNIELIVQQQQNQSKDGDKENKGDSKDNNSEDKENKKDSSGQDPKNDQDSNKDQNKDENKDQKNKDQNSKEKNKPQKYEKNKKPQPQPYSGKELPEGDVKKILGELKQQEQKIRAQYYNKEIKENPNGKDW